MLFLAVCFASTFILMNATGVITIAKIEAWLEWAGSANAIYIALIIAGLLYVDLIIAVPSLAVTMLGGYFLGPTFGAASALGGFILAGTTGFWISRRYGDILMNFLIKDTEKCHEAKVLFKDNGAIVILLSRAAPMLPEISACMAGMTGMPFLKFLGLWLVSITPYSILAAYAGSISSLDDPMPAILTAIGISSVLWMSWLAVRKLKFRK